MKALHNGIEIEFEEYTDLIDRHDSGENHYQTEGTGTDGKTYIATAVVQHGEWVDTIDIEEK